MFLLAVIGEVLRAADAEHPERVSTRAYDAARESVGHGATPRADKLCARFGVSWEVLRDLVLHDDNPATALALARRQQVRRVLTRAEMVFALQRAAARLGTDQLTASQYEQARRAINEDAKRRHLHGAQIAPMPTADTIRKKTSWPEIAREAGLSVPDLMLGRALAREVAVRVFIEHYGFRPRKREIEWFGRYSGIGFTNVVGSPHGQGIALAAERFAAEGRWFPPQPPRFFERPDGWQRYSDGSAELAALAECYPRKRVAGEGYSIEEAREAIRQAFDVLGPGEHLTGRRYREVQTRLDLPSLKAIYQLSRRHDTSFAQMVRDEAAGRASAARRSR